VTAPAPSFAWNRSNTLALAKCHCCRCHGLGFIFPSRRYRPHPCSCVLRTIFHACLTRYRHCQDKAKYMSNLTIDFLPGPRRQHFLAVSRKDEEYCADFYLLAKRTLDPWHFRLFQLHFLAGRPWGQCIQRLHTDRGFFFHGVYRIQEILGCTLAELLPYPLWPLDDYFHSNRSVGPLGIVWRPQSTQHYRAIDPDRLPSSNPNGRPRGLNYHIHTELRQAAAAHAKE